MASDPPAPTGGNSLDLIEQEPELDPMPKPGQLGLIGRRAFKTWQVVLVALIAVGIGMAANYRTVGSGASSNQPGYHPPPPAGATTATTTTTIATSNAAGSTTTTTAVSGATTTTYPSKLLLAAHQQAGNWTSPSFTANVSGWIIGWAFQCSPAPASGPSLQVFVTAVGGTATGTAAVSESGASGQEGPQNVTTQSSVGAQQLIVEAPPQCTWAVKVTGN